MKNVISGAKLETTRRSRKGKVKRMIDWLLVLECGHTVHRVLPAVPANHEVFTDEPPARCKCGECE